MGREVTISVGYDCRFWVPRHYLQHYGRDDLIEVDTSRIAVSVVSAVGFIAGGAILRTGLRSKV
jgi:uncharacterized membrane protein YhiD involved in acid resistance